jgi:cytochrome c-type biogenesis protein CcmH/NrfF
VTAVRVLVVVAASLALAAPATACTKPRTSLPALEGQVMCPTCHTTLDQSDSAVANRIRAYISRRIDECATAGQIKQELVDQFGSAILAAPPRKGFDLLAWWLPIAGIIVGAAAIGGGVWRWTRGRDPDPDPDARLDPESERRVDDALAGFDG